MLILGHHVVSTCHMSTNAMAALLQQQSGLLLRSFMDKAAFDSVYAKAQCKG